LTYFLSFHWRTEDVMCKHSRVVSPTASMSRLALDWMRLEDLLALPCSVNFSTLITIETRELLVMPCEVHNELRKWKIRPCSCSTSRATRNEVKILND
jgi:hypothetical protein